MAFHCRLPRPEKIQITIPWTEIDSPATVASSGGTSLAISSALENGSPGRRLSATSFSAADHYLFCERELSEIKLTPFPLRTLQTDTSYEMRAISENYTTGQIRCAQHRDDITLIRYRILLVSLSIKALTPRLFLLANRPLPAHRHRDCQRKVDDRYQTNRNSAFPLDLRLAGSPARSNKDLHLVTKTMPPLSTGFACPIISLCCPCMLDQAEIPVCVT